MKENPGEGSCNACRVHQHSATVVWQSQTNPNEGNCTRPFLSLHDRRYANRRWPINASDLEAAQSRENRVLCVTMTACCAGRYNMVLSKPPKGWANLDLPEAAERRLRDGPAATPTEGRGTSLLCWAVVWMLLLCGLHLTAVRTTKSSSSEGCTSGFGGAGR